MGAASENLLRWLELSSGLSPLIQEALVGLGKRPRSVATELRLLAFTEILIALVIVGRNVDVVATSHVQQIAQWLDNGSFDVIREVHFKPVTQARQINKLISECLGAATREDGS